MRKDEVLGPELMRALDEAVTGREPMTLYALLCRHSRLPGPRPNEDLARAFGITCAAKGAAGLRLARTMTALDADRAQGDTEEEFLPICGVAALTQVGRTSLADALPHLHDAADDLRFRVRDAARAAVIELGEVHGAELLPELTSWLDGYFHAAAVVNALGDRRWLATFDQPPPVVQALDAAFLLARDAPRAAARYPGFKALVEDLGKAPARVGLRFGVPVLEMLARWAASRDPAMRAIVAANLRDGKLQARLGDASRNVEAALTASAPVPRDPTRIVHGTRRRAKR